MQINSIDTILQCNRSKQWHDMTSDIRPSAASVQCFIYWNKVLVMSISAVLSVLGPGYDGMGPDARCHLRLIVASSETWFCIFCLRPPAAVKCHIWIAVFKCRHMEPRSRTTKAKLSTEIREISHRTEKAPPKQGLFLFESTYLTVRIFADNRPAFMHTVFKGPFSIVS